MQIISNIDYKGPKSNFERDSFKTLEEMKNYPLSHLDNGHFSFCAETEKHYKFLLSNEEDPILGKWREFKSGSDDSEEGFATNQEIKEGLGL